MVRNAMIAGATGLTGGELTQKLIRTEYYNSLHLIGRRPFKLEHLKINSYTLDLGNLSDFKPKGIIQDVYICLGTTMKKAGSKEAFRKVDFEYVLEIGQWAKQNKVEKLAVISSIGATSKTRNFYLKTKGEMEEAMAALALPALLILRPSLLLGGRDEVRLAESISAALMRPLNSLMVGRLKKYRAVESRLVAEAMFKSLLQAKEGVTIVENEAILNYL